MIRTFIDSGVLIWAARGEAAYTEPALQVLEDSNREFASSIFLRLEVLPKAVYNNQAAEIEFYETYFDAVAFWAMDVEQIIQSAYHESSRFGLGAMDALHVAAAVLTGATEFITSEKNSKSIHRTKSIQVISLRNQLEDNE